MKEQMEQIMKVRNLTRVAGIILFAALANPVHLIAQQGQQVQKHPRYKLIDIGTFGGPASATGGGGLNNRGMAVGGSFTSTPIGSTSNDWPCANFVGFVPHAFEWRDGALADLGTLPGSGNCSNAGWINDAGITVGNSETSNIDPIVGIKEIRAVLWKNGHIKNLGTLGGAHSGAQAINNRGQIVGFATNTIPDPYSAFYAALGSTAGTQTRAALWQNGTVQDLGSLGGPDAFAFLINDRGQIAGSSYTAAAPDPVTGIQVQHPFFWENGQISDMGTLGGTFASPSFMNNRGQVAGTSNLAGDMTNHAFFWDRGVLTDLGTFGGTNSVAIWINDAGEVVGTANLLGDQLNDAFLWKNGVMTDLGNLGQTSFAFSINSKGQVVGHSKMNDGTFHAFLWDKRGPMIDLNSLIPSGSTLLLVDAFNINDRGEITGMGLPPGCHDQDTCGHAYVLIPRDESNSGSQDQADRNDGTTAITQSDATLAPQTAPAKIQSRPTNREGIVSLRDRLSRRYHLADELARQQR